MSALTGSTLGRFSTPVLDVADDVVPPCTQHDPEMFFPDTGRQADIQAARAVCRDCPILAKCLNAALAVTWTEGIWAGTTADERTAIRRRRARKARA